VILSPAFARDMDEHVRIEFPRLGLMLAPETATA